MKTLEEIVEELAARPCEEEWFEFKTNCHEANVIGEYISALSNAAALKAADEGYLLWGIHDKTHEVVGTDFDYRATVKGEPLEHFLARQLTPDTAFSFEEGLVDHKRVVVMRTPPARQVPTAFNGKRFLRIGSSKVNLSRFPEREAALFRALLQDPPTMENTPAVSQEMSFTKLFTHYANRGIELRRDTFEKNLGLLTPDGDRNLLAQLLSDASKIPVRVSVFRGKDKTTPLVSVREFGNTCLLSTLEKILEYGDVINLIQADERNRTVAREESPLFKSDVFREAVVNAFVHNKWVDGNAPMVTVYSDRLEIVSRGKLGSSQTTEGFFRGESIPVNRRLSDIFLQLHISERSGRGVPTIVDAYGRDTYEFRENSIALTIPFAWIQEPYSPSEAICEEPPSLTPIQADVYNAIKANPHITQPQLVELLGSSRNTVQRAVSSLREAGLIERVGSNKTGYWEVH